MERIPPVKTDAYGLRHQPFLRAPEFAAHKEERARWARERVRAATDDEGRRRRNVYRTDDLWGGAALHDDREHDKEGNDLGGEGGRTARKRRTILWVPTRWGGSHCTTTKTTSTIGRS